MRQEIAFEGWLHKKNTGIVDWWSRRYFVVQETELRYYNAETDAEPKCVIQLDDMVLDSSISVSSKLGKPHAFTLKIDARHVSKVGQSGSHANGEKTFQLAAPDPAGEKLLSRFCAHN
eukprot:SAG31_NODE_405_length_16084_cov_3.913982_8_plen_118_part_00